MFGKLAAKLQAKKATAASAPTTTATATTTTPSPANEEADVYAMVRSHVETRKRSRDNNEKEEATQTSNPKVPGPSDHLLVDSHVDNNHKNANDTNGTMRLDVKHDQVRVIYSEATFEAIIRDAIHEVDTLLASLTYNKHEEDVCSSSSGTPTLDGGQFPAHCLRFLREQCRLGVVPLKQLIPSLACVEDAPQATLNSRDGSHGDTAASSSCMIALPWTEDKKRSRLCLWTLRAILTWRRRVLTSIASFEICRAETDQLSAEEVFENGARIAVQRGKLKEFAQAHNVLCKLLLALVTDLHLDDESSGAAKSIETSSGSGSQKNSTIVKRIVPDGLVDGLCRMATHADRGEFVAAEDAYYQTTIGNEKWRLGLYSAGDMHMRKTLEKTQRDRIFHILNNEQALACLHAVKRILTHQQNNWQV